MRSVGIGLFGFGTVGGGVVRLLQERADELAASAGARLELRRIVVRDRERARDAEIDPALIGTDPESVLGDPDIQLVVELVGGDREALAYVRRAIDAKKAVVTANKLVLATHGTELIASAVAAGVDLAFEGAVGGGIPIVRTLREALVSDRVTTITGILNGTSNYVLSRMLDDDLTMEAAIAEAQAQGYAEADPSTDVGGFDAAHKLAILALLGFGAAVAHDAFPVEGITELAPIDHRFAARFGYRIKPLAIGRRHGDRVELRVHPALVAERSVLANVSGVLNAVLLEGEALGPCLVYGPGAGALPTAVSVVSDIVEVARSIVAGVGGLGTRSIRFAPGTVLDRGDIASRYYVRFTVHDEPGVMARLAGSLGDAGVSIGELVQDGPPRPGEPVSVVLITHRAREAGVRRALESLSREAFMQQSPVVLRIEDV